MSVVLRGMSGRVLGLLLALTVILLPGLAAGSPAGAQTLSSPVPARAVGAADASDLCAQVGYHAGFRGESLVTAVAVALAESSCNPQAYNRTNNTPPSTDRGLWQINDYWHAEVSDACAYDAQCNANEAFRISSRGTDWSPWSTYNQGHHQRHMGTARGAVDRLDHPGPGPAPLVYPAESGRVVSARSADGRLEVFAAGADGVHHAWQENINGTWSEWEFIAGPAGAELAIGPNADGRLEVFAINDRILQHRYQDRPSGGWSGWEDFGEGGHDLAVGSNNDGRLEVFASGPEDVFHRFQTAPNSGWSGWEGTGGGPGRSRIELAKAPDGRLEVFALNAEVFQHLYQTAVNGGWSAWEDFGTGGHDLTVDHNQDGRLEVFASGPVGVFHRYQTGPTNWSGWKETGGLADSRLTSQRTVDGRVEVFAINASEAQHMWQTGVNASYSPWETFGTGGTEITAAANADGRIEVFGTNPTGVYHRWQTGFSTWSRWGWLKETAGPAVT
ncbi:transglycosylase SLT domain-containing protein [Streptomyces griseus]|uniref:transglycosylase SLT domain-containing protein n=1 Tax=Streptomyces griseus TaxID=1911 RepID=UPI0036385203